MSSRLISKQSPRRLRAHLQKGGLVAYPTESCYGIGCSPRHIHGLRAVLRLKKRPQHKGMIVIGKNTAQLQSLLNKLPENILSHLNHIWPAAQTFILPAHQTVLPQLRGKGRNKLAVRVPDHTIARNLCTQVAMPLVSTSCNRAGGKPCRNEREVRRRFGKKLWVIGGKVGNRRQPSSIVDWESGQTLR
ncbi:MAG: L-threonylcarbamoyladenylate synthase [Alysiella sp.]|uniref:L-threonylcarbamoyladenylate synthase n=1 Tax=Alysiella sp. TaxID=1872483 RepID=UPI0026DD6657|nr:L-threonylcarbamoyladenylate synthase [Alysiella sp.]MDO4434472.1 L-threonylcarbamoyladenylate synthase [Alysiella sp.]